MERPASHSIEGVYVMTGTDEGLDLFHTAGGREVFISFRGEPLRQVAGWVHEYERFWNTQLDQFERYFARTKAKKQREKQR